MNEMLQRRYKKFTLLNLYKYLQDGNVESLNLAKDFCSGITGKDKKLYALYFRNICCHERDSSNKFSGKAKPHKKKMRLKSLRRDISNNAALSTFDNKIFLEWVILQCSKTSGIQSVLKGKWEPEQKQKSIVSNNEILRYIKKYPFYDGIGKFGVPQDKFRYGFYGNNSMEVDIWRIGEKKK